MNTDQTNSPSKRPQIYRFRVMQGNLGPEGQFEKAKVVGMAYLLEGQRTYAMKLWTFVKERFYVKPLMSDSSRFTVVTRERSHTLAGDAKQMSNIVGNGKALAASGVIRIELDLFEKPLYMSIYPEDYAHTVAMPKPEVFDEAA